MTFECKLCGSNVEPNEVFCAECGASKVGFEVITLKDVSDVITLGETCCRCRVDLSPNKRNYVLGGSQGCIRYDLEYCKECYKAELIERKKWKQIYEGEQKAARAQCKECKKPFTGIFRKKRFAIDELAAFSGRTRDYYCKDCFLALPKNETLDKKKDFLKPG